MVRRQVFLALALTCSLALAACGGSNSVVGGGTTTNPVIGPGSLIVTPASLSFSGPGAASQTFTISSTLGNLPAPAVNLSGCSPVASIGTASTTLPATYTVTPQANGSCTFTASLGNAAAAVGITVGPTGGPNIVGPTNSVALFVGGTSGSVSVTASSGTFSVDSSACNGIASVTTTSSGVGAASYAIAPLASGSCQIEITNGSSSFPVLVVVNQPGGAGALQLNPTTLVFASQSAPDQQTTLSFTGNVGQVAINEDDCIGKTGKGKIVFALVGQPGQPVSLPAVVTVRTYTTAGGSGSSGTCVIHFVPQNGTGADLTVTVQ